VLSRFGRQLFYAGLLLAMAGIYTALAPISIGRSLRDRFHLK